MIRTYTDLIALPTFEERFNYLKLDGQVGLETFGFDRYLNQNFYRSKEWKRIRDQIIVRDNCCDLAMPGHDIYTSVYIHHMNPIRKEDLLNATEFLMDPEYLICVTKLTHDAIHYGDIELIPKDYTPRIAGDTTLWGRGAK